MATFELTNPTLILALLSQFVEQIDTVPGFMDQMLSHGVPGELIDRLRSRATLSGMRRLAGFRRLHFNVSFDDHALMASLDRVDRMMDDDTIKEYLARNGASTELLCAWFSLSKSEAGALRDALQQDRRTPGRPRLPDLDVRDAIHAAWTQIPTDRSEREAFYELHQQFPSLTVSVLHQVVHEHDVGKPPLRGTGSRRSRGARGKGAS